MDVIKYIGFICVIAGGAGAGYSMSAQVGRRYRQLGQLMRMVALLMGEIAYAGTPIPEAMEASAGRLEQPLSGFLRETAVKLKNAPEEPLGTVFRYQVMEMLKDTCLTKNDLEALCRMGNALGYLDREMQLRNLRLYEEELRQELADAWRDMPGKKKLYQTLGIMGGLFLVILLL